VPKNKIFSCQETSLKVSRRPVDEKMALWFDMVCNWLDTEANGELYTVSEVYSKMKEFADGEEVYAKKWLKKKIKDRYKESVCFSEINGHSDVVCFREMASYILNDAWYESRNVDKKKDSERIIATAAKLIMADIRQRSYDMSYYPTHNDIVNPEEKQWVPETLKILLNILIQPEIKQQSIGQTILYAARPRSVIPLFHLILVWS
jgi:hypothetical protein